MAIVRPFMAVRPQKELAKNVASLPYDVMNRKEAKAMANGNKYSFLHISRSEIDMPDDVGSYDESVYKKAKENLDEFLKNGTLIQDEKPLFYIYKQTMGENTQIGIVSCVSIDDYEKNIIKKHELTRVEKEEDRIRHFDACDADTEPVFLTYKDEPAIKKITSEWIEKHEPEYDFVSEDGIGHVLWLLDDEKLTKEITDAFANIKYLYIADGHHRSASAYKVGKKRREQNPGDSGEGEFNYFMAVVFPGSELNIYDYNRVVKDLAGLSKEEFLAAAGKHFEVTEMGSGEYRPQKKHEFGMFLDGAWYKLTAKAADIDESDPIASLDVAILQDLLLEPILGIKDPRTDKRIDFVGGIRGLSELERRVNEDMAVAFAVYPVSVDDLMNVADSGMIMPPKSTWFEPKLGSGLFVHKL